MLPPIRCFTCNSITRWREYDELIRSGLSPHDSIQLMGRLSRYCCRRMLITHPQTVTKVLSGATCKDVMYDDGSVLHMESTEPQRVIACD